MRLALLAALALSAAPPAKAPPADAPRAEPVAGAPSLVPAKSPGHSGETPCAACHATSGWTDVKFAHDKTGFPLLGQHRAVRCKACHPLDFKQQVPPTCDGCHVDVHAGELGARCDGCHAPESWRSRFPADAHRRSAFPLVGRHAALPCAECHFTQGATRYARDAASCGACHQADYDRTRATGMDHAALAFPATCQGCHGPWRWTPAQFPQHSACFTLDGTEHARIPCGDCHTALPPGLQFGTCNTRTAACTNCHEHECARTDPIHAEKGVLGYQCRDRKCYECHRFAGATP